MAHRIAKALRLGALLLCSTAPTIALAQTEPPLSEADQDESAATAQPAEGQADDAAGDENNVVVTAQRREQRLEDIPISITSIDADLMETAGVISVRELDLLTPGLTIRQRGNGNQTRIRGVGTTVLGAGADPGVALYVDGFYIPTQTGNFFEFNNIERVDVLKGPQGTLFGRNAMGGAILVTTLRPSFTPTLRANFTYGSRNDVRFNLYGSIGITDTLAADVSGYIRRSDGFVTDLLTGRDVAPVSDESIRASLLFRPTANLTLRLAYDHTDLSNTPNAGPALPGSLQAHILNPTSPVAEAPPDYYRSSLNFIPKGLSNIDTVHFTAELDLGDITLTSLTGYRDEDTYIKADNDRTYIQFFQVEYDENTRLFTQEFLATLAGPGPLDLTGGLYYYNAHSDMGQTGFKVLGATRFITYPTVEAYAAFLDGTYELTDRFSITLGGRYSVEERGFSARLTPGGPLTVDTSTTFESFTPRAVLQYRVAPRANVYASYSRGFKSGMYDAFATRVDPVRPETLDAFELGFRSGGRLQFAAAGFYYDLKDIQITSTRLDPTAPSIFLLQNAASAEIYGAEASVSGHVTDNLTINAGIAWTHGRFRDFPQAASLRPKVGGGYENYTLDASGLPLLGTPEWQINAGLSYRIPTEVGEFGIDMNVDYETESNYEINGIVQSPSRTLLGARVSWAPDEHWELGLSASNILDERYLSGGSGSPTSINLQYGDPRAYYFTLSYRL